MSDLELFKEITRAIRGVASDDESISKAVARVRALFQGLSAPLDERLERKGKDRLFRGGLDREEVA